MPLDERVKCMHTDRPSSFNQESPQPIHACLPASPHQPVCRVSGRSPKSPIMSIATPACAASVRSPPPRPGPHHTTPHHTQPSHHPHVRAALEELLSGARRRAVDEERCIERTSADWPLGCRRLRTPPAGWLRGWCVNDTSHATRSRCRTAGRQAGKQAAAQRPVPLL